MEAQRTRNLRLEGDCTIATAPATKALLLENLAGGGTLELDLEGVGEADVTLLQLLAAAGRAATEAGGRLRAQGGSRVLSLAREAGFEEFPLAEG